MPEQVASHSPHGEEASTPLKRGKRAVTLPGVELWPNGVIPYVLTNASSNIRRLFLEAAEHIAKNSTVRFVERTNEPNYIYLSSAPYNPVAKNPAGYYGEPVCVSFLGMKRGLQEVTLTPTCQTRETVLHELMHAIGFTHEHQRSDRGQYVYIANVDSLENSRNIGPYDVNSVTHYGPEVGIRVLNPNIDIRPWPRETLSAGDIAGLEALYGNGSKHAGPAPTDNRLRVELSKYELVLAENTAGDVELKVSSDDPITETRVESENPLITANAVRTANNNYTIKIHTQAGTAPDIDVPPNQRLNRIFFHLSTAGGKTGVAIFRVSVVKPAEIAQSFRQLVSLWRPEGSARKYCLEAENFITTKLDDLSVATGALSVGLAPCDPNKPLQLWRQDAKGRLISVAKRQCLSPMMPRAEEGRTSLNASNSPQCQRDDPPAAVQWRYEAGKLINAAYPRSVLSAIQKQEDNPLIGGVSLVTVIALSTLQNRPVSGQQWVWY